MSSFFASGGQSIGVSASACLSNIQYWFPLGLTDWISLQSKRLSRVFSNTTVQKHQFFGAQRRPRVLPSPKILLAGIHLGWAMSAPPGRTLSQNKDLAKDNPETNPINIKPKTVSHMAEQFAWVPLSCSPPGHPFPIKSLALSACTSPLVIHFWVLDKSLLSGPGTGSPSCNAYMDSGPHKSPACPWEMLTECSFTFSQGHGQMEVVTRCDSKRHGEAPPLTPLLLLAQLQGHTVWKVSFVKFLNHSFHFKTLWIFFHILVTEI